MAVAPVVDDEVLIELVEKNPLLYQKSDPDFKNTIKKRDVWNQIAAKLNLTSDSAQKRWTNLRDAYMNNKRKTKEKKSGDAAKIIRPYKYGHIMEFLKPHLMSRGTSSNIESLATQEHDDEETSSEPIEETSTSSSNTSKKSKNLLDDAIIDIMNKRQNKKAKTDVDFFFASVAETVNHFPKRKQIEIKLKIQEIITEAELQLLEE